ncbi:hypothetical protein GUITHDRAFT_119524 [Guillardia theta CCMP2712]|uniref:Response regulatory domain-containing protein n=1 Tax=Guillardia theta (strain CCMP2712) TaxID=905079 RepID=L1IDH1_GUITC|nr:hypothetical protein GUITHDRAFT_119524 [Guillardia theta CCMP2712]EKX34291.1 hypothetical protein GUITHDRAFT_119524 [Guillardia theta CCMP2712]|eukprot:XP_005821271.1 hypothetical protein GUITHDRAFT_119524 [Guillardia theta CCMP2712]
MDVPEALAELGNRDYLPDLCLVDVMMPSMDGYEVVRKLRTLYPDTLPIVMVSANLDIASDAQACGADAWDSKPLKAGAIVEKIQKTMEMKKSSRRSSPDGRAEGSLRRSNSREKLQPSDNSLQESNKMMEEINNLRAELTVMQDKADKLEEEKKKLQADLDLHVLSNKQKEQEVSELKQARRDAEVRHMKEMKDSENVQKARVRKDLEEKNKMVLNADSRSHDSKLDLLDNITNVVTTCIRRNTRSFQIAYCTLVNKNAHFTFFGTAIYEAWDMTSLGFHGCIHISQSTYDDLESRDDTVLFTDAPGRKSYLMKVGEFEHVLELKKAEAQGTSVQDFPERLREDVEGQLSKPRVAAHQAYLNMIRTLHVDDKSCPNCKGSLAMVCTKCRLGDDFSLLSESSERDMKFHFDKFGKYEILSVDDDQVNQMVIENILRPSGYEVKCVGHSLPTASSKARTSTLELVELLEENDLWMDYDVLKGMGVRKVEDLLHITGSHLDSMAPVTANKVRRLQALLEHKEASQVVTWTAPHSSRPKSASKTEMAVEAIGRALKVLGQSDSNGENISDDVRSRLISMLLTPKP